MKKGKNLPVVLAGVIIVFVTAACTGGPSAQGETRVFPDIIGKNWYLTEIRTEPGGIILDRAAMEADGLGDAFTLKFEEDQIGGVALPNRYFGPYTRKGHGIQFNRIASTLMASFKELDITEREYFDYLDRVQRWAWNRDHLELHSTAPTGQQAVLIFEERVF
ncbi:MAG: META domain-containing protein [Spirochaetaceae bacterium]|jgi:hypothetical protein|nr:META domain-containing protein [Spirochaetaceae bacterium]